MYPFTTCTQDSISSLGERALIEAITGWLGEANDLAPSGIGDDTAVIPPSKYPQLITVDSLVYGRHFDDTTPAQDAGAKLLKRNLSDIAAMGGTPAHAVIACFLPATLETSWLQQFYEGIAHCALQYGVRIAGGDITACNKELAFSLTLTGQLHHRALTRKSTRPGDSLWVTGSLGGSILGKHLSFPPHLPEGQLLAQSPTVTACMDLSDGLATDLKHLLAPGHQAVLAKSNIPIATAAWDMSQSSGLTPLEHALSDGEDFELLFSLAEDTDIDAWTADWKASTDLPLTQIGHIRTRDEDACPICWDDETPWDINLRGYEHLGNA